MLEATTIASTRQSAWVANLVVLRKKNDEIRLCVDFRNLNQLLVNDNYTLANMENLLEGLLDWAEILFMLDGFSSYNQVLVKEEDRSKTYFTTPWGTLEYHNAI